MLDAKFIIIVIHNSCVYNSEYLHLELSKIQNFKFKFKCSFLYFYLQ